MQVEKDVHCICTVKLSHHVYLPPVLLCQLPVLRCQTVQLSLHEGGGTNMFIFAKDAGCNWPPDHVTSFASQCSARWKACLLVRCMPPVPGCCQHNHGTGDIFPGEVPLAKLITKHIQLLWTAAPSAAVMSCMYLSLNYLLPCIFQCLKAVLLQRVC